MKSSRLNRRRHLEQTGERVEFSRIDLEFVTDDILQLMVYLDVTDKSMEQAAWQLALAIDAVALQFDRADPPSFMAFVYSFNAAWSMVQARPHTKRREAADIDNLPAFLGGSEDPE